MNRAHIIELVARQTGSIVQNGPFQGMRLALKATWGDGDLISKLLGLYEEELHPALCEFAGQSYDAIVDIGAADGYYAVGAARLFTGTPVHAFDINPLSHQILRENAEANNVSDRIACNSLCSGNTLRDLALQSPRLLIIADCEGGENEIFHDADVLQSLVSCDLIIECHDFMQPGITGALVAKFFSTHFIEVVYSGSRNPNQFRFLSSLSDFERWMAICENRPALMNWLICRSKTRHLQDRSVRSGATATARITDQETMVTQAPVNIVLAVDDAYTESFLIAILSAVCNTDQELKFHIISTQGEENLARTSRLAEALGISCTIKTKTDLDIYFSQKFATSQEIVFPAHYYRLFAPDLFPEIQRTLYLDSDLIVRADLGLVWNTDLDGHVLAAVADPSFLGADEAEFRAAYGGRYFNSGVILVDFSRWRAENVTSEVFGCIVKYTEHDQTGVWRQFWDQSPLKMALKGRWLDLSPTWNFTIRTRPDLARSYGLTAAEYDLISADPGIFHFLGGEKPWRPGSARLNRFFVEYHRYRHMIQRLDVRPTAPVAAELNL